MNGAVRSVSRLALAIGIAFSLISPTQAVENDTIVVGSKNFAESRLLAEMFAQAIEAETDLQVDRRFNLAGTQICFEALQGGAIDLYPEYTGTGWVSILGEAAGPGRGAVFQGVRHAFERRWNLIWLPPLGFENAYELALPRALAESRGLTSISDLAAVAGELRAGLGYEFVEREDGLPGLRRVYRLEFANVVTLQQALKYEAVRDGVIDVLDVYTTDGRLVVYDLRVLIDDRNFFPPYEAAPLIRGDTLREHPEIAVALLRLAGAIDEESMRGWNLRLQERGEEVETVAADALRQLSSGASDRSDRADGSATPDGAKNPPRPESRKLGLGQRLLQDRGRILGWTLEHLKLTVLALLAATLCAIPLALWLERHRGIAEPVIRIVGTAQTIPSIALLAFMVPWLGIGTWPALVALWVYALFPILRNAYTGLRDAPVAVTAAAEALGMTPTQVLLQVRLPMAMPILLAGLRTSAVLTVGAATLAAFIGAGGLGVPIVAGLQLADTGRILSGAIPAAILALAVDRLLAWVERAMRPPGMA